MSAAIGHAAKDWIKRLLCFHGPLRFTTYPTLQKDGCYGLKFCERCGEIKMRYYIG